MLLDVDIRDPLFYYLESVYGKIRVLEEKVIGRVRADFFMITENAFYGKEAQSLVPGDIVTIPAGVKHWHGAKKDSWFSHIAVECPGHECSNEWCEPVSDAEYQKL